MEELNNQPEDSSLALIKTETENSPSNLEDFWRQFNVFSLRLDEYIANHWYLFTIGFLLAALVLSIVHDIYWFPIDIYTLLTHPSFWAYYWNYYWNYFNGWTQSNVFNLVTILLVVALILTSLSFNAWKHSIPRTFQALLNKGRVFSADGDINQEFLRFLKKYQETLESRKRYIFCGIAMIATLICLLILFLPQEFIPTADEFRVDPLSWILFWLVQLVFVLFPLFWAYCFGIGAWIMCVSGIYIRKLTLKFDFNIQPSHPDGCGGLKVLGDFCLAMALPILIGAVLLGIYGIGLTFSSDFAAFSVESNVGLIFFAFPLATIAFFAPLWNIHRKMVAKREEYQDDFASRVAELEKRIQSSLDKGRLKDAKIAMEKLEIIQTLHPSKIDYPNWPFNRNILLKFLIPQILAILTVIAQLAPVVNALRSFFGHPNA